MHELLCTPFLKDIKISKGVKQEEKITYNQLNIDCIILIKNVLKHQERLWELANHSVYTGWLLNL